MGGYKESWTDLQPALAQGANGVGEIWRGYMQGKQVRVVTSHYTRSARVYKTWGRQYLLEIIFHVFRCFNVLNVMCPTRLFMSVKIFTPRIKSLHL